MGQTVYGRFWKWVTAGLFEKVFSELIDAPDMENLSLDLTIIRSYQKTIGAEKAECLVENQAIGLSRGGRTIKIHAVVDGLGNPIRFLLTGGQVHDSRVAC